MAEILADPDVPQAEKDEYHRLLRVDAKTAHAYMHIKKTKYGPMVRKKRTGKAAQKRPGRKKPPKWVQDATVAQELKDKYYNNIEDVEERRRISRNTATKWKKYVKKHGDAKGWVPKETASMRVGYKKGKAKPRKVPKPKPAVAQVVKQEVKQEPEWAEHDTAEFQNAMENARDEVDDEVPVKDEKKDILPQQLLPRTQAQLQAAEEAERTLAEDGGSAQWAELGREGSPVVDEDAYEQILQLRQGQMDRAEQQPALEEATPQRQLRAGAKKAPGFYKDPSTIAGTPSAVSDGRPSEMSSQHSVARVQREALALAGPVHKVHLPEEVSSRTHVDDEVASFLGGLDTAESLQISAAASVRAEGPEDDDSKLEEAPASGGDDESEEAEEMVTLDLGDDDEESEFVLNTDERKRVDAQEQQRLRFNPGRIRTGATLESDNTQDGSREHPGQRAILQEDGSVRIHNIRKRAPAPQQRVPVTYVPGGYVNPEVQNWYYQNSFERKPKRSWAATAYPGLFGPTGLYPLAYEECADECMIDGVCMC